jgi:WD40 repeat protein
MKHIILFILLTLGVWAEEVGVPYVENMTNDIPEKSQIFSAKESKAIVIRMDYGYNKPSKLLLFDFDLNPMKPLLEQVAISYFDTMTVHNNKIYLATEKQLQIWDIDRQTMINQLSISLAPKGQEDRITVIYIDENESLLVAGTNHHHIYIWDMQTQKLKQFLRGSDFNYYGKYEGYPKFDYTKGHQSTITALALSHDQKYLYSGSFDNTIKIWNLETGKEIYTFRNMKNVRDLWISHDDHYLIPHQYDTNLTMLDIKSLRKIRTFSGHTDNITSIAVSPDEKRLYTAGNDKTFRIWDIETGEQRGQCYLEMINPNFITSKNGEYIIAEEKNQLNIYHQVNPCTTNQVKLYFTNRGEWSASTSRGYFVNTKNSSLHIKLKDLLGKTRELEKEEFEFFNEETTIQAVFHVLKKQK